MKISIAASGCLWLATAAVSTLGAVTPARAQGSGAIYRCHGQSGALVFQDKPCNTTAGTVEAGKNQEGEIIPQVEAPPESGTPALDRYTRYLDLLSQERREQQASDQAEASLLNARLNAEAQADNLRRQEQSYGPDNGYSTGCDDGSCGGYAYGVPYAVFPQQRFQNRNLNANANGYQGPYRNNMGTPSAPTPPNSTGTKPSRPVGVPFQRPQAAKPSAPSPSRAPATPAKNQ